MRYILLIINTTLLIVGGIWVSLFFVDSWSAEWIIRHTWYPSDSIVQSYVQYAYKISWGDLDFVSTLESENWLRDPQRQSEVIDRKTGRREDSWGFCQLHRNRHSSVVDDPRFKDPYRQLEQCWSKYKWGTRFYWYDVRQPKKKRFAFDGELFGPVDHWISVADSIPLTVNTYMIAERKQSEVEKLEQELRNKRSEAIKAWKLCIDSGECKE